MQFGDGSHKSIPNSGKSYPSQFPMLTAKIQHNFENSEKEVPFLHVELPSNTALFHIMLSWENILGVYSAKIWPDPITHRS